MLAEELDIVDNSFVHDEVKQGADGVINVPIMDVYPNPENTFDVFLHSDGMDIDLDVDDVDYSHQDGNFQLSGDDVAGAVQGVAEIASLFQKSGIKKAIKDSCGRRPVTKKKRDKTGWTKCEQRVRAIASGTYVDPQEEERRRAEDSRPPMPQTPPRGMSRGAKIGIGIGVVAVVGIVGFILYKRSKA